MSFSDDDHLVDPVIARFPTRSPMTMTDDLPLQQRVPRRSGRRHRTRWLWRGVLALIALGSVWFLVYSITRVLAGTVFPAAPIGGSRSSVTCPDLGNGGKTIQRGTVPSTPPPRSTMISCPPAGGPSGGNTVHGTPPSGTAGGKLIINGIPIKHVAALQTQALQAVAQALGLPVATVQVDLQQGQSVSTIAQAQHVALSAVNTAYLTALHTWTAQAVRAGDLSQQQADHLLSLQQQAVEQGVYVFLGIAPPSGDTFQS